MILLCAITVAALVGIGLYLIMSARPLQTGIGFMVLSNGINLGLIAAGGAFPEASHAPLIHAEINANLYVDPLPQAFVLTAIVIGFGVLAFVLGMVVRLHWQERDEAKGASHE